MASKLNRFEHYFAVNSMLEVYQMACSAIGVILVTKFQLKIPKRKSQKGDKPQFYLFRKYRKRIETLFSQWCIQFMIDAMMQKLLTGLKLGF